jgi:hypothetical protein
MTLQEALQDMYAALMLETKGSKANDIYLRRKALKVIQAAEREGVSFTPILNPTTLAESHGRSNTAVVTV